MFIRWLHYSSTFKRVCVFTLPCVSALNSLKYLLPSCRLVDDIPEEGRKTFHQLPSSCKRTCRINRLFSCRDYKTMHIYTPWLLFCGNESLLCTWPACWGPGADACSWGSLSLSLSLINVLLASAIRTTRSDQWRPKASVQVYLSLYSKLTVFVIGINLNATWLIRDRDWDGPVSQSVSRPTAMN